MAASRPDTRRWMEWGTTLAGDAIARLDEQAFSAPTALPGWTRKHLVAHLAANAEAIGNLVRWAATGTPTPMYDSPTERATTIEVGSHLPGAELAQWFARSASALGTQMDALNESLWATLVVTAQGRTVPASETPWMRTREVMVHAVDLGAGVGFGDLPPDFLMALCNDVVAKRSTAADTPQAGPALLLEASDTGVRWLMHGAGTATPVTGTLAAVASYLCGRGAEGVAAPDHADVPDLPAWL